MSRPEGHRVCIPLLPNVPPFQNDLGLSTSSYTLYTQAISFFLAMSVSSKKPGKTLNVSEATPPCVKIYHTASLCILHSSRYTSTFHRQKLRVQQKPLHCPSIWRGFSALPLTINKEQKVHQCLSPISLPAARIQKEKREEDYGKYSSDCLSYAVLCVMACTCVSTASHCKAAKQSGTYSQGCYGLVNAH